MCARDDDDDVCVCVCVCVCVGLEPVGGSVVVKLKCGCVLNGETQNVVPRALFCYWVRFMHRNRDAVGGGGCYRQKRKTTHPSNMLV